MRTFTVVISQYMYNKYKSLVEEVGDKEYMNIPFYGRVHIVVAEPFVPLHKRNLHKDMRWR